MFHNLLKKCKYFSCDLVLCGDIKQLPPVGKGRPFECIINSELFNTVHLTEIKRQDTGMLKDCIVKINKRELTMSDFDGVSTMFIEHDFTSEKETIQICNKLVKKFGRDNIAFITPENNKQPGVFEMNKLLQNDVYNSTRPYTHGNFKEDDFVIRTENKYDDDIIRVNGDSGKISFRDGMAHVRYDDDPLNNVERVPLTDIYDNFKLNYCNTVHKYQGSQKDVVVFICSSVHASLSWGTNRLKLAYTAISRAAKNLVVIGCKETFFNIQNCKDEPFVSSFMSEFNECEIELEYE
jgi:exodeoxyribonuclease V alpha subunit